MQRSIQLKPLLIAPLGESQRLLCSLVDSRAASSTFHCYPSQESTLWSCRAPLQDSLWTSGKLQWINGYCSQVSCWGLACAIVSRPCRSLLLSTYHESYPTYGQVRANATGCYVCFSDVKDGLLWHGLARSSCKQEGVVSYVSNSTTVVYRQSPRRQPSCNMERSSRFKFVINWSL